MDRLIILRSAVLVVLSLAAAWADDSEATKAEMAKLQGEWSMVSGEAEGQAMPEAMRATAKRVAKDNETTVMIGGQLFMKAQFSVDPSKKPKTIDYTMIGGFTTGKKQLGIYELDGDQVKFCFGSPGKDRPTEFTTQAGGGRTLSVWKRARP